ncbi:MAG: hypothetical protein WBD20_22945 [Pirellulaceae bacterium]
MNHRYWSWGVALALFLCLGCVESDKPLSDPATSKIDPDLIGTWLGDQEDTYVVSAAGDGFPAGMHRIDFTDEESTDIAYFFVTKIGDQKFINLPTLEGKPAKPKWSDNKIVYYSFAAYEVGSDSMTYKPLERKTFNAGVKRGNLSIRKIQHDDHSYTLLTNTTEEIRAFIKLHAKTIVSDSGVKLRLKK